MPPTKTPVLIQRAHNIQQQQQAAAVQSKFPPPKHPNNIEEKQQPLLQSSASQPNLRQPNKQKLSSDDDSEDLNSEKDITDNLKTNPLNKPVYYRSKSCFRWIVLFLSCWAMFGSYYCYDNPTALAKQIKSAYGLSATEYNLLYSVYSFPNIILPLFGGGLVDRIGAEASLLIFLCLVTIGQAIFAFAASISSYPLMLLGRTIYGLGGESLCVAESALLAVYFVGTEVAFAMGLNLSLGRAGSSLNDFATLKIYRHFYNNNESKGFSISMAIWAGFGLLCICLAATVIMIVLDRIKAKQKQKQGFFVPQAHSGEIVKLSDIYEFNVLYWLLTISCIVVYGCVLPWNNVGSSFMEAQYNFTSDKATKYLMIPYLTSAFCVPFIGYGVDRIGKRSQLLVASTTALTLAHFIFAFFKSVNCLIPLILLGISYSIYASAIWPAVALVVKENKLGTAYGFITSVQNGGLALFPIIVGQLTGNKDDPKEYYYVEIFFFALGYFGIVIGLLLWFLDYKGKNVLAAPSIKKDDNKQQTSINDNNNNNNSLKKQLLNVDDDDTNISLQTPQLLIEEYDKGNLQRTPVLLRPSNANDDK